MQKCQGGTGGFYIGAALLDFWNKGVEFTRAFRFYCIFAIKYFYLWLAAQMKLIFW